MATRADSTTPAPTPAEECRCAACVTASTSTCADCGLVGTLVDGICTVCIEADDSMAAEAAYRFGQDYGNTFYYDRYRNYSFRDY